jgi:hypothetical protein
VNLAKFRRLITTVFSHIWKINLIQVQQYYEKQVMLRRGHIQVREGKRKKLRR